MAYAKAFSASQPLLDGAVASAANARPNRKRIQNMNSIYQYWTETQQHITALSKTAGSTLLKAYVHYASRTVINDIPDTSFSAIL